MTIFAIKICIVIHQLTKIKIMKFHDFDQNLYYFHCLESEQESKEYNKTFALHYGKFHHTYCSQSSH